MAKYSKSSQEIVEDAMSRMKRGKLRSGSGQKVKNPRQAIAIGLSEAREKGAKVPPKKASRSAKQSTSKGSVKAAAKKAPVKKVAAKKVATKKPAAKTGKPKKAATAHKKAATRKPPANPKRKLKEPAGRTTRKAALRK